MFQTTNQISIEVKIELFLQTLLNTVIMSYSILSGRKAESSGMHERFGQLQQRCKPKAGRCLRKIRQDIKGHSYQHPINNVAHHLPVAKKGQVSSPSMNQSTNGNLGHLCLQWFVFPLQNSVLAKWDPQNLADSERCSRMLHKWGPCSSNLETLRYVYWK